VSFLFLLSVPAVLEDYKLFWFDDVRKDETPTDEKAIKEILDVKMLAS
jgi:hypothetical protein